MKNLRALVVIIGLFFAWPAPAATIADFEGVFVGVAENFDGAGHKLGERHVDMTINPLGKNGFEIVLTSVLLVDGRRDVPGVRHRKFTATFEKASSGDFFLSKSKSDLFAERQTSEIIAGEPLEWAQIDGSSLVVYTFAILADGRYEIQVFERALDGDIMRTLYERHLDGVLQRQTVGRMVRSD